MHPIQEKILQLLDTGPAVSLTLREIGSQIGETGSPQKIKHHLDQLASKGFLKIDRKRNRIEKTASGAQSGKVIALPILGSANCGEATFFADNHIEGYLHVTKTILGHLIDRVKDLFVLEAVGPSMNQANVSGDTIQDGDYVIVDRHLQEPKTGAYVVSIIDGVANIKKLYIDEKKEQLVLLSESNQDIAPIYIHKHDLDSYLIAGTVVKVMKKPNELEDFRETSHHDVMNVLGRMPDDEVDYYNNPDNFKKKL